MIRKASELLARFIEMETRNLDGFDMPHMPTLGTAYEEITKQGIFKDFSIPKNLDLRVVSGFISVGGKNLDEQVDCMLVHGDGHKFGLTEQYRYDVGQVLCIFEVKKTLRKNDYVDALHHLAKIKLKFSEKLEEQLNNGYEPNIASARKRFSQVTGKVAPESYRGIHALSCCDGLLFSTLIQESLAPVTIVHGYGGYKTEHGLRKVFLDILEDAWKKGSGGFGVTIIPTVVTAGEYCIVKGNGTPFLVLRGDEWVSVFSTRHNSAKLILELIWAKIESYFGVEMPWDDGLHMDSIHPLLFAKAVKVEKAIGWEYITEETSEKNLRREDDNLWKPSTLGNAEVSALNLMMFRGGYLPLDKDMDDFLLGKYGVSVEQVAENLILTREFMRDGAYIRPIHAQTYIITNEDETGFVASEVGRFELWCEENEVSPNFMCICFMEE